MSVCFAEMGRQTVSRQSDNVLFYQIRNVLFWEC
jgi:hypothetical protein